MNVRRFVMLVALGTISSMPAAADDAPRGGVPMKLNTPRVLPIDEKDWTAEQRELLAPLSRERSSVPNLYRTLIHSPKMFTPRYNFGRYIKQDSTLPAREREMLICRIAWLSNAEYEWAAHTRIGLQNGLTSDDIKRIAIGPAAAGWSAADKAVMQAVDELYDETFISDSTWNALATRFNQSQMMDLVMTVGCYHMLAMLLDSAGVQLESGAIRFAASRDPNSGTAVQAHPRGKPGTPTRLSAPRIAPIPEAQWSQIDRELLEPLKRERGSVPNVYGTLSRHPQMYPLWLAYARYILRESSLPAREREMLILRIAWLASGEYEWAQHKRLGQQAGLTPQEIERLAQPLAAGGWSDVDRAIVQAADELHMDTFISDPTWKTLSARFNTPQMMDLALTVGAYKMLAMALNSFGTQLESGVTGFPK